MLETETPEEMFRCLTALRVLLTDLGDDAADEKWLRRKFVKAVLPYEYANMTSIRGRSDYRMMSANDILSEIVAMNISKKSAEDALARGQGAIRKNLALKAKAYASDEDEDEDDDDESPDSMKHEFNETLALTA